MTDYSYVNPIPGLNTISDATGRTAVSPVLDPTERTFIAILEGQSLAGNHCQGLYQTRSTKVQAVNVLGDHLLYQHIEPMLGASYYDNGYAGYFGGYGSVWGEVGDILIRRRVYDRVIWCNITYGGEGAFDFSPAGVLSGRMPLAFNVLALLGFPGSAVNAILTMIGEKDNGIGTTAANYKLWRGQAIQVARNFGFTGKWYSPLETYSFGTMSNTVRGAQFDLASTFSGVVTGPDFDTLGASYRYFEEGAAALIGSGKVHPNTGGRDAIAGMWADALTPLTHIKYIDRFGREL